MPPRFQQQSTQQHPHTPLGQDRARNLNSSTTSHPPTQSRSTEPHRRGFQYNYQPKLRKGDRDRKPAYTYMIGVEEDGTPH